MAQAAVSVANEVEDDLEVGEAGRIRRLFRLEELSPAGDTRALTREAVEGFYRMALAHEDLAPRFRNQDVDRLKSVQTRHWDALFAGARGDDLHQVLRNSVRVGRIHVDAMVDPVTYFAGYEALVEDLVIGLTRASMDEAERAVAVRAILRCCFADMAASTAAYTSTSSDRNIHDQLMAMSDSLEREMSTTLAEVRHQVYTLTQVAGQLESIAGNVTEATGSAGSSANSTREGVLVVASAANELESSSQQISEQTSGAAAKAAEALENVEEAKRAMQALTESAAAIGGVTELVQSIAKQTRLLALNATIEAARAGEAGKGFAVVAGEVKSLAAETEKAISSVHERTQQIATSTDSVNRALGGIVSGVGELSERARTVASSADEQRAAIGRIARSAEQASVETGQVADQIAGMQATTEISLRAADRLSEISSRLGRDVGDLQRRITTMLRSSNAGNRRRAERVPVGLRADLEIGGVPVSGHMVDLSVTGALFYPGYEDEAVAGKEGTIEIDVVGRLPVRVVATSPLGVHLQFLVRRGEGIDGVRRAVAAAREWDAPMVELCRSAADRLSSVLEGAVSSGRMSIESLFDDDYVPVEGSDPQQYTTAFVDFTDQEFPAVQEAVVRRSSRIVFCAAVDRNAFLPTHNHVYSKPQRPGDRVWNMANCRNRRIWDDRAGLLAARNTQDHAIQSYVRDMGGGNRQVLKEVDCPIRVGERIWGNLRLAYRS